MNVLTIRVSCSSSCTSPGEVVGYAELTVTANLNQRSLQWVTSRRLEAGVQSRGP